MTPDEAIRYNEELKKGIDPNEMPKHHAAVGLGIEALKFLIWQREHHNVSPGLLLPGETEE